MAGDDKPPESPMNDPGGLHTPPPPALRPTLQHEVFYALLANGEIADPAEVESMVDSLQSLMPLTSPEEARLHLSQNRWSFQETILVTTLQSRLTSCTPEKAPSTPNTESMESGRHRQISSFGRGNKTRRTGRLASWVEGEAPHFATAASTAAGADREHIRVVQGRHDGMPASRRTRE